MPQFVRIKHTETGAIGKVPVDAVDIYSARGYEVVDDAELAESRREQERSAFDPADGSAKRVHDYLTGLDRATPEGQAEYDRVVAAEQNGQNRTTAFPG
jgi:hypothetical protein